MGEIEIGSDNVFKDLGYNKPKARIFKSMLAQKINSFIETNKLDQKSAAKIMGLPQSELSLINKGIVSGFSTLKIIYCLRSLENKDFA